MDLMGSLRFTGGVLAVAAPMGSAILAALELARARASSPSRRGPSDPATAPTHRPLHLEFEPQREFRQHAGPAFEHKSMNSTPHRRLVLVMASALAACGEGGGSGGGSEESDTETATTSATGPSTDAGDATETADGTGPDSTASSGGLDDGSSDGGSSDDTGGPGSAGPDLDGDGEGDFVVGARGYDGFTGALWVYYGDGGVDASSLATADAVVAGTRVGQNLGLASAICDLDGDGIEDLLGASLDGVHVYWGGQTLDSSATADLMVEETHTVVRGLRCADVTGDGTADIVSAGADFDSWMLTVVPGSPDLRDATTLDVSTDPTVIAIAGADASLRPSLAVGDVNGDGDQDILIGVINYPSTDANPPGAGLVYFGGPGLSSGTDLDADVVQLGEQPGENMGLAITAGDLDADGVDDFAISSSTSVRVYRGSPTLSNAPMAPGLISQPQPLHADIARQYATTAHEGLSVEAAIGDLLAMAFFNDTEMVFVSLEDALSDNPRGCALSSSPVDVYGWSIRNPVDIILGPSSPTFVTSDHGPTGNDFQPAGPGAVSAWSIIEEECAPIVSDQFMALDVALAGSNGLERTEVLSDDDLWSAYLP
jgi:hypothetical protein